MNKKILHLLLIVELIFPALSLASPIGVITNISIMESGIGPKNEGCAAFVMTADEVHVFFNKTVLISGRQEHDFFLYGPCSIRGTLSTRYDTWQWQIRNLGTGTITASNGDTFSFGNPEQESTPDEEWHEP
ncbi:hypothetical protein [Pseudomonas sp. EA_35y_Pfl2_R5]|uniref:hypothetical protein n=1 Tax=Pseudomonas sp. EA_35y_Pfl2_R5 TaxID=3088690 RepID=UPI0030DD888A